ncbi:MAG: Mut7-C RNAse domain-containing protein [Candidatus Bipolaricaulia bacterium]
MAIAHFRFYGELNDFLPLDKRQMTIPYEFQGAPSVKDAIEALGVPHVEVDLILVNGESVGFSHHLSAGERVAVYPVWESLDITSVTRLRGRPLRRTRFVADVHLGKLARLLRLLGFDTLHSNVLEDEELITIASREGRILLTRDRQLLKRTAVTHGYWIRSVQPIEQAREVVRRFDLAGQVRPFTRCLVCNGMLISVAKEEVLPRIPPKVANWREEYYRCTSCDRLYWRGSHYSKLGKTLAQILSVLTR